MFGFLKKIFRKKKPIYRVTLLDVVAGSKVITIKEVRMFTGLGLKEAKELVDNVPSVIPFDTTSNDAVDIFCKAIGELGGSVSTEVIGWE